MTVLKKTLKWEGARGFYKGVASPIAGQMFFRATLYSVFGQSKALVQDKNGKISALGGFIAGAMTGSVVSLAECPIDFLKSQLQVQIIKSKQISGYVPEYSGVFDCGKKIVAKHGFTGIYQGLPATFLRNIPANAFFFGTYEVAKSYFLAKHNLTDFKQLPFLNQLSCGGLAGVAYWLSIYPFDVIKSSMQADSPDKTTRKYRSIPDCAKKLWNEGGIRRFYRGFTPCMMRSVPANAAMFFTFETVRSFLTF
eukprot:TRINITY_DN16838_c0_g1_i1.p1 TRINITY_DN16838_c0_g1~~TRINITY_DN16838_c0_g1_i1.p1  ORF type:complete len:252 (+),score=31.44 TRINITY_DN16838_c0_g1_i1:166-921(+)